MSAITSSYQGSFVRDHNHIISITDKAKGKEFSFEVKNLRNHDGSSLTTLKEVAHSIMREMGIDDTKPRKAEYKRFMDEFMLARRREVTFTWPNAVKNEFIRDPIISNYREGRFDSPKVQKLSAKANKRWASIELNKAEELYRFRRENPGKDPLQHDERQILNTEAVDRTKPRKVSPLRKLFRVMA